GFFGFKARIIRRYLLQVALVIADKVTIGKVARNAGVVVSDVVFVDGLVRRESGFDDRARNDFFHRAFSAIAAGARRRFTDFLQKLGDLFAFLTFVFV